MNTMAISKEKPSQRTAAAPERKRRRKTISEEVLRVRAGPICDRNRDELSALLRSPDPRKRALGMREISSLARNEPHRGQERIPPEAFSACVDNLSRMLKDGFDVKSAVELASISAILRFDPKTRASASTMLDEAFGSCVGSLRTILKDDEAALRSDAILGLYALAKEEPDAARAAVPDLKDCYCRKGIGIRLMVLETLAAIVEGVGYPFGIIDKGFFEVLKEDLIEAERMCHRPSAIDRKDYFERFMDALRHVLGLEGAITKRER